MKKNYPKFINKFTSMVAFSFLTLCGLHAQTVQTFSFTGTMQSFTVPPCVSQISVDVKGAQGGMNPAGVLGGQGGSATGVLSVSPGDVLNMIVGGMNGFNGGGAAGLSPCLTATGGVGGGASDIRLNGTTLANRVIVGGGGGGAGGDRSNTCGRGTGGGGGGGYYGGGGGAGYNASSLVVPTGGTQVAGGAGGVSGFTTGQNGLPGLLGFGGDGGLETSSNQGGANSAFPGGAGGGLVGANGQQPLTNVYTGQSGAGGSSYAGTLTNTTTTTGNRIGNGIITITYNYSGFGVSANASSYTICSGNSINLIASNVITYTWSSGGSNSNSISVSPTVNTTYTVQGTNLQGCVSSLMIPVFVDNTPTVTAVSSNTTNGICPNSSLILTGSGATSYTWTGGVTNAVAFNPTVSAIYVVTGANACSTSTAAVTLSIHPVPLVTASANNPTICSGNSVILNAGGTTSFTWSPSIPNNVSFFPITTTNYTVIGTSALGCTAAAVAGVTVLITPTIAPVASPTAVCFGSTATLSAVGATGYTWTPGVSVNAASVTVSPLSTTIYTLVRTNGACTSTANVTLVIDAIPSIVASASPTQICVGEPVVLNVFGAISYTWLPGNFSASNFTLYPNSSTCYTVAGSNGSCSAVSAICVSVNPSPSINILTPTISICEGSSITFTATGAPSYTWLTTGANINNSNITVTPSVTSQYTVLGSNAFNCVVSKTQLVIVNAPPSLSLTSSIPYACVGSAATLSVGTTSPNSIYTWSGGSTGSGPSITVNPTITTSYIATGVNTQNGCTRTDTIALSVYISTFVVSSPTAICKGSNGLLSASGAANSYDWFGPSGIIATTSSVSVSPSNSTTYYVTGTTGSCTTTQTVPLIVNVLPNVTAVSAKPQLCRLEFGTVTASGATSYVWAHGVTTAMFTFNTLTITTTYTVTGTDNNGCSKTAFVTQYIATCAGIDALTGNTSIGLNVYPNPNNGNFSISSDADITVSIVNAMGQVVSTMNLSKENKNEITVSSLPTGIYFITGEKNGLKVNKKIIIE